MATLSPAPKLQFFDAAGVPLVGGKLYSYQAGTTTPLATYTDASGATFNTNPVILDSRGEANVWLGSASYKLALYTATDVLVWTVDNISSSEALALAALAQPNGSSLIGFLQSGSGAVATTVQTKLRENVSVFDFMTAAQVADVKARTRTLDVSAAINSALAVAQHVYFPAGAYRVDSTITVINMASTGRNLIISGDGGGYDAAPFGTVIYGNTGSNNWIAKFNGSQWVKIRDIKFMTGGATPSTHGLMFARNVVPNAFCHNIELNDVFVVVPSSTGATGGQGSIAVLNNQCEGFMTRDCWLCGDTPYLGMLNNEVGIAGVADAGIYSNTLQTHVNTCFLSSWKTAMSLYGAADMDFQRCIWTTDGITVSGVYAITLNNSNAAYQYCSSLRFTGQVERFTKAVYLGTLGSPAGGAQYTDLDFDLTKVSDGSAPNTLITVWTGTAGANLFNVRANFPQQNATPGTQNVWAADTGNTGTINLYGGKTVLYQNTAGTPYAINNVLIKPFGHAIDAGAAGGSFAASNIVVAAGSSYQVSSFNDYLRGSVVWNPPSIANAAIANTAVTVTGAALGDSVRVFPPYSLSGLQSTAYVDSANTVQIILGNLTGAAVDLASGTWNVVVQKS